MARTDKQRAWERANYAANREKSLIRKKAQHALQTPARKEEISKRAKKYQEDNKEKIKALRETNKDKLAIQSRKYYEANKEAIAKRTKVWREVNKDRIQEKQREYEARNKDHKTAYRKSHEEGWRARKFGLTLEDLEALYERQNFRCAICLRHENEFSKRLSIDHCHNTGHVRGLLCGNCNLGIGKLQDSSAIIDLAITYIKKHRDEINAGA